MRTSSLAQVIAANVIIIVLIVAILEDFYSRIAYWESLGFTPQTTYFFLTYVTSATKGSTYIPGEITLDWVQVLGIILVLIDAAFVYSVLKEGRSRTSAGDQHGALVQRLSTAN
jgi:hypothetical protein